MNELQRWMTENAMSFKLQLLELEKQHGLVSSGDDRFISFNKSRDVDSPVANFAAGKMFSVGLWDEVQIKGVVLPDKFSFPVEATTESVKTESVKFDGANRWPKTAKMYKVSPPK